MTSIEKEIEASTGKPLPPVEAVEAKAVKNLPYSALFKGKLLKRTICGSFSTDRYEHNSVHTDELDAFIIKFIRI